MTTNLKIGLSCVLALGFAACGTSTGDNDAGTTYTPQADSAVYVPPAVDTAVAIDTTPVAADPYVWIVIQDTEQKACTTNGPGADIDAVALVSSAGKVLGYGKKNTASFTKNPAGNACENADCNGSNCKYASISSTFSVDDLVARTEGPYDGIVNASTSDVGYFSLNGGTLQLQIGDTNGVGAAQAIMKGDQIQVYEVDQTFITDGFAPASCSCLPEHYTVFAQTAAGVTIQLKPTLLDPINATCAPLTATSLEGCGSTLFVVP